MSNKDCISLCGALIHKKSLGVCTHCNLVDKQEKHLQNILKFVVLKEKNDKQD